MKKIIKSIFVISIVLFSIYSCTDESTFRNPSHFELEKTGAFPKLTEELQTTVGVDELSNLVYEFTVYDPNESIDTYTLSLDANLSGTQTATFEISTVDTLPHTYTFTAQELADILEVTVNDFNFGDTFHFTGACMSKSGIAYDATTNTQETLIASSGYRNAFDFAFTVLCPNGPTVEDLVGTWAITRDVFDIVIDDGIFDVIAGPGDNQVTFVNPFGHTNLSTGETFNIVMDIDTDNHSGSFTRQDSWDSGTYGLSYGIGRTEGSGTVFTCIGNGFMTFDLEYTVDAGSFGTYAIDFTKL